MAVNKKHSAKVLIAMSGGVDSSVAAATLIEQGYQCAGVFMRMAPANIKVDNNLKGHLRDVQRVTKHLGIELYVVDFSWEMQQVIDYFCYEYSMGRTPNPCIRCNAMLKFGKLLAFARNEGMDFLATGHYARIVKYAGFSRLAKARSVEKDQSYFLFGINRKDLASILFPNGNVESKDEIREKAKQLGLPNYDKQDSQEICFVPDDDYVKFLSLYHKELDIPGKIVDLNGKVLGEHKGVFRYTIGQRRGLRISAGEPLYVIKIDPTTATIIVGPRDALAKNELLAEDMNWHINPPRTQMRVQARIRSTHKPADATLLPLSGDRVKVVFEQPQFAITPGQAVVFYENDVVIGGGWIKPDD